jgi:hypothetical protein
MAGLLDVLPLQVRTLLEAANGINTPITEKTIGAENNQRVAEAILASRAYKQSLLDLKRDNALNNWQSTDYKRYFPNEEAIKLFKSGAGAVGYDDYYNAGQGKSDWNMLPSGSIRNTLGQFRYTTDKNGNVNVTDKYDFQNDTIDGLPKQVANSKRYEGMSTPEKWATLAKETVYMPQVGFDPILGLKSVPSRFGNAFVGTKNARKVNITLPKTYQTNPTEDDLYFTRLSLTK